MSSVELNTDHPDDQEIRLDPAPRRTISVVIPCFNEQSSLVPLLERLEAACVAASIKWEAVLVNDGSSDETWRVIQELTESRSNIVGLDLSRNFGKEVAMMAGLDQARGDAVVFMDGDLQHPPESVPDLVAAWQNGAEVVDAVRHERTGQKSSSRLLAMLFYRLFGLLSGMDVPEDVGDFRLIDAKVADTVRSMRERQRFTKGLMVWIGYRRARVPYRQSARLFAPAAEMSLWSKLRLAAAGITSFSSYPLRIWSLVGFVFAAGGFVYAAYRAIRALFHGIDVPGFESIIAIMLFFGGLQLITLGILGEYIGRIYDEAKGRPLYIIRERAHGSVKKASSS